MGFNWYVNACIGERVLKSSYCVQLLLFLFFQFFDEGLVLYFYESPPGYGLITMRLIGWLWFLYAIFFTLKHHPNKSNFYFPFFIFYTLW